MRVVQSPKMGACKQPLQNVLQQYQFLLEEIIESTSTLGMIRTPVTAGLLTFKAFLEYLKGLCFIYRQPLAKLIVLLFFKRCSHHLIWRI